MVELVLKSDTNIIAYKHWALELVLKSNTNINWLVHVSLIAFGSSKKKKKNWDIRLIARRPGNYNTIYMFLVDWQFPGRRAIYIVSTTLDLCVFIVIFIW